MRYYKTTIPGAAEERKNLAEVELDTLHIENSFPIPKLKTQKRFGPKPGIVSRTLDALKVGQSFVAVEYVDKALASAILSAKARTGANFVYRKIEGSEDARVWRIS